MQISNTDRYEFDSDFFNFCLFPFVLFYFFKVSLWTSLCSRLHIFARGTAHKYMTDKLISLSLPLALSPIIFQLRKIYEHL